MKIVGMISAEIESLLQLSDLLDRNIYIGASNVSHMRSSHPDDYERYKNELEGILLHPDYVGTNKRDASIEYVKEFRINNEFVKVAVRVSKGNRFYARSMYVLNSRRVANFISKGTLLPVDNHNNP